MVLPASRRRPGDGDLSGPRTFTRATVWDPSSCTQTSDDSSTRVTTCSAAGSPLAAGALFLAGDDLNSRSTASPDGRPQLPDEHVEPRPEHGGGPLVPDGHAAAQRRDADHGGRSRRTGGARRPVGRLRSLTTASRNLPLYPWLDVAPDGRAFYSGPEQDDAQRSTRTTTALGRRTVSGTPSTVDTAATHCMTSARSSSSVAASSTPRCAGHRLNAATPQVTRRRRWPSAAASTTSRSWPMGSVLATGGNSSGA